MSEEKKTRTVRRVEKVLNKPTPKAAPKPAPEPASKKDLKEEYHITHALLKEAKRNQDKAQIEKYNELLGKIVEQL